MQDRQKYALPTLLMGPVCARQLPRWPGPPGLDHQWQSQLVAGTRLRVETLEVPCCCAGLAVQIRN